jgi:4-amino-4-deoxy-L-arabinose transferase-like glycosyltransferase
MLNRKSSFFLVLIILIFFLFVIPQLKKPFLNDEFYFINSAKSINEVGYPIVYDGEQKTELLGGLHPPFFMHILAISFKLFGSSEIIARLVPVLFAVGTIILIYLISMEIFKKKENKHTIALISCLVYVINPLVIQGSLLIDIDGGLLTFLMMMLIYTFIKTAGRNYLLLSLIMVVALWAKIQAILFLVPLFLFYLLNKRIKEGIINLSIIGGLSVGTFLVTWFLYSTITPLHFNMPFEHSFGYIQFSKPALFDNLLLNIWAIKNMIFWTTPPFLLLVSIATYQRVKTFLNTKKALYIDLLLIYGLVILFFFMMINTISYGFPKYLTQMMPLFSILLGHFIANFRFKSNSKFPFISIALILLLFLFHFLVIGDPFIPHNLFYTTSISLGNNLTTYLLSSLHGSLYLLPILITFIILLGLRYKFYTSLVLSLIIVLIVSGFYIDYVQSKADYSTIYNYGQEGFLETADYIRARTTNEDVILAPQVIADYAGRKYYHSFYFDAGWINFTKTIKENDLPYLVIAPQNKFEGYHDLYEFRIEIGHFKIYQRKEDILPNSIS